MKKSIKNQETNVLSNEVFVQLAKAQNKKRLYDKFPNIEHISGKIIDGKKRLTIFLKDDNNQGIPKSISVRLNEETKLRIQTNVISPIEDFFPDNVVEQTTIQETDYIAWNQTAMNQGSICCFVGYKYNKTFRGVVTAGHVFTNNTMENLGSNTGIIKKPANYSTIVSGNTIGELFFQKMGNDIDIAVVELKPPIMPQNIMNFKGPCQSFKVGQPVVILSKINGKRSAVISGIEESPVLSYSGIGYRMIGLISITKNNQNVSDLGDSGGCVYDVYGYLIGMILGQNDTHSFVLPLKDFLSTYNFHLL
jgi:hypothetical protein